MRHVHSKPLPPHETRSDTATIQGEYTRPMHPEVRQQGPGECPKYGMALEAVAPPPVRRQKSIAPDACRWNRKIAGKLKC